MSRRRPHVALIGGRGVPARYGGFETLTEELACRLVELGWRVTVYCRAHYTPRGLAEHRGAELVVLPTIRSKYLDTPVHTLLSALHAAARPIDVALVVNAANALFVPLLRANGVRVALHVDGIEKRRAKWGWPGRAVYAVSERLAARVADRLITDAEVIREHYLDRFGAPSRVLRYGVDPRPLPPGPVMRALGLESRRYVLYVSRFEPENNPHRVVEAYADVAGDLPLVMVGDAPYAGAFIRSFREAADARVLFPGAIYGDGYRELLSHAAVYVQATEVGGTHPALVEALGYGNCVVANGTPENVEAAADAALYFDTRAPQSLTRALGRVLEDPALAAEMRARAARLAARRYDWDVVAGGYARLFEEMIARG